jgi:CRP-like cAMP-binding protein
MSYANHVLAALPADELERVAPHLERHALPQGRVLIEPERPIDAVWFLESGVVSQLSVMADGTAVETATIGREGMVGMPLFHGVDVTPEHAFMQLPGVGHCVRAAAFRALLPACPTLARRLHRIAQATHTLVAQTSACNRLHSADRRLARWLLVVHDRVAGDRLDLTQQFLAEMLGVRRATVTVAAGALQAAGAIRYTRGRIVVLDRDVLERASCECYAIVRSAFDRAFDVPDRRPSPLVGVQVAIPHGETRTAAPVPV